MPQRSAAGIARAQAEMRANPAGPQASGGDGGRGGMGMGMGGMSINRGVDTAEVKRRMEEEEERGVRARKRMSSPELWEARQLIASGVLPVGERPDFDAEAGGFLDVEETEEEMEVELNDEEPAFLAGQTQFSRSVLPSFLCFMLPCCCRGRPCLSCPLLPLLIIVAACCCCCCWEPLRHCAVKGRREEGGEACVRLPGCPFPPHPLVKAATGKPTHSTTPAGSSPRRALSRTPTAR